MNSPDLPMGISKDSPNSLKTNRSLSLKSNTSYQFSLPQHQSLASEIFINVLFYMITEILHNHQKLNRLESSFIAKLKFKLDVVEFDSNGAEIDSVVHQQLIVTISFSANQEEIKADYDGILEDNKTFAVTETC